MSGLDALRQQNNRGKGGGRSVPPARHKPRETPVELAPPPTSVAETAAAPTTPVSPPRKERAVSPPIAAAKSEPAPATGAAAPANTKPEKVAPSTIYFDKESDDWLEQACIIGRQGRPKIDTRSGFVRLAVRLLAETMSPEEAVAHLRAHADSNTNRTGRPRL